MKINFLKYIKNFSAFFFFFFWERIVVSYVYRKLMLVVSERCTLDFSSNTSSSGAGLRPLWNSPRVDGSMGQLKTCIIASSKSVKHETVIHCKICHQNCCKKTYEIDSPCKKKKKIFGKSNAHVTVSWNF